MTKPPNEQISDWVRDLSMDFFFAFLLKSLTKLEIELSEASSKHLHNLRCKHTFMRSVLAVVIVLKIPK